MDFCHKTRAKKPPPKGRGRFLPDGSVSYASWGAETGQVPAQAPQGNAGIRIDDVLAVAFRNGRDRAFLRAGAARDAIVADNICHGKYTSLYSDTPIIQRQRQKSK